MNGNAARSQLVVTGLRKEYATPAELKARPANLFVGTFIGEPPMNVFPVEVKDDGQTISFAIAGSEGQSLTYAAGEFPQALRQRLKSETALMLGVRPHAVDPLFADLGGEDRAEAVPPVPHNVVADVDPALVEQVLYIS